MVAFPCLDGLLHRNEVGLLPVCRLDADDDVAVLFDRLRKRIEVHVVFVLLGNIVAVGHARSDNVEEGEDAGRGVVNDAATKLGKVAPTRGARIGDGGHAVWDGHDVGRDREVAVAPGVVAKPGEDVYVHVDKPGREIEAGDVYGLLGGAGRNGWFDSGNLAVANGYVTFRVDVVFRIEDLAIAQNEIVLLSVRRESTDEESGGQDADHWLGVYRSIAVASWSTVVDYGSHIRGPHMLLSRLPGFIAVTLLGLTFTPSAAAQPAEKIATQNIPPASCRVTLPENGSFTPPSPLPIDPESAPLSWGFPTGSRRFWFCT